MNSSLKLALTILGILLAVALLGNFFDGVNLPSDSSLWSGVLGALLLLVAVPPLSSLRFWQATPFHGCHRTSDHRRRTVAQSIGRNSGGSCQERSRRRGESRDRACPR